MYEQDYVMRLIKEMVRAVLKLIFHIDTESPAEELLEDSEVKTTLDALLDLVDEGRINEAENIVYEITENREYKHVRQQDAYGGEAHRQQPESAIYPPYCQR